MSYQEKYQEWLSSDLFDEATKAELKAIASDEKEIEDRFYKDLEFGTGGLRGVLGAGTNRMNIYTVRRATQGLANYILKAGFADKGVAIAYDSRRMSPEFSTESALVLAANGIKGYVFDGLRPTPELSFAVRELGCVAGIVVTASHNPPEYNGYKVYWSDGAQVSFPMDEAIIAEVFAVTDFADVKTMSLEAATEAGLYQVISNTMDDQYIEALKKLVINKELVKSVGKDFKVVYTPLHGTGNIPVRRVLKEIGFEAVSVVKEQELPDGNFPTVDYPNPEDIKAFALGLKLAKEINAELVLATDPDADRLGILVLDKQGEYVALNGNQVGALILDYIITQRMANNTYPANGAVVETIVSTNMGKAIARYYGLKYIEVLTGFKYIGEQIKLFEETGEYEYLFGFEESYGCLVGTHARDKDAVVAAMTLCEVAAYYKDKGLNLVEALNGLYEKYGYFKEDLKSITLKGKEGLEKINATLEDLRKNPIKEVGGVKVVKVSDYQLQQSTDLNTGITTAIDLPTSNVLYYDLENAAWFCIRPSGTEPKVKIYFGVKGYSALEVSSDLEVLMASVMSLINEILGK